MNIGNFFILILKYYIYIIIRVGMINNNILDHFGVDEATFTEALELSPSSQGYIAGAISEILLKRYLENMGYEVVRIKEKPSGGNNAKNFEARGDFYVRKSGDTDGKWLVVESKGLKSNSEFRGGKLDSKEKVVRFLKTRIFNKNRTKEYIYNKGYETYLASKENWLKKNPNGKFPPFMWDKNNPGPESYFLEGLWGNEGDLIKWADSLENKDFSEDAYRNSTGAISILETHQPSTRKGRVTKIQQAAPLVGEFNIMSVDLFLRTGVHEFVFMNSEKISHSPSSPEHLYQNYTIDILVKGLKVKPVIQSPWYDDFTECIKETSPEYREIDKSQIDYR